MHIERVTVKCSICGHKKNYRWRPNMECEECGSMFSVSANKSQQNHEAAIESLIKMKYDRGEIISLTRGMLFVDDAAFIKHFIRKKNELRQNNRSDAS